jgi:hypothetical protein
VRFSSSGPRRRAPLLPSSSVSRRTRGASCSLLAAQDTAPVLPAAEPHGSLPRRRGAPDRGGRTRVDNHPAGIFASNWQFWWASAIRDGDVVRWPYGAAETAPIDERDIAAVAARALYDDRHAGGDYVLTGPESLSQAEQIDGTMGLFALRPYPAISPVAPPR